MSIALSTFPIAEPILAVSSGVSSTIWAIFFWGFLIAALVWLAAWLMFRDDLVGDAAEIDTGSSQSSTLAFQRDIEPHGKPSLTPPSETSIEKTISGTAGDFSADLSSGRARVDSQLGVVYVSAPEETDDLTQISGVGAVLEEKLHEFGVYYFRQIAHWPPSVVAEFNDRLSFKGRIERDCWIDQAHELHRKKYGIPA